MRLAWPTLLSIAALAASAPADVTLPPLISEGMVLQSQIPVPIWGNADPGENVTVTFAAQTRKATADADGRWQVVLDPLKASDTGPLVVKANNQLTVRDVVVGEVWLASGQSNMEYYVQSLKDNQAASAEPSEMVRLFKVEKEATPAPVQQVHGKWVTAAPKPPALFSAVGYLFGCGLHQHIKAPVGIIQSTWGGTRIDAWTSMPALQGKPELARRLAQGRALDEGVQSVADFKARVDAAKAKAAAKKPTSPCEVPSRLYNGMIHPLAPYALRGVLWYQGESDAYQPQDYRILFPLMIQDWRKTWGQQRLPFLFVQLPSYKQPADSPPSRSFWAVQRESQTAALSLPDVGMIVTIDIGEESIHPRNKKDLVDRLLRLALGQVYGQTVAYKAPSFEAMKVEGKSIRLTFKDAALGLKSRDGQPLKSFAIAGADRKFVWADARIDAQAIIVSSDQVKDPVAVRYAFQENPPTNLVSNDDLPVSPFRTDDWW